MQKIMIVNKMEKKLNWKPSTELEEGIKKAVEWYVGNKKIPA